MMLFGREMSDRAIKKALENATTPFEEERILSAIHVQKKIAARKRMENETDPDRREMMEELYNMGQYNFDTLFGKQD